MIRKRLEKRLSSSLRTCLSALLLALICMLLTPLSTMACGGMFTADAYTEQSAERLIFAVDPGQVTLYEQIHYTGTPKDFAWVLPLPAPPRVSTASVGMFNELSASTAPSFTRESSDCGSIGSGAIPPASTNSVNVVSSGIAGPYSYDVINSSNSLALLAWLTGHHYKIPAESVAEMQPYISAHMFFLAMRLRANAGVQDMKPVKVTYASTQPQITIPLRMATPMGKERLGVLIWIFGQSRYVPQNYQSLQISDAQFSADPDPGADYKTLVDNAVDRVNGHGFITEYAQPTSNLYHQSDQELQTLKTHYSYLTRLYTEMKPAQITLDPGFVPRTGLSDVSAMHTLSSFTTCDSLAAVFLVCPIIGIVALAIIVIALIVLLRRKRKVHLG